jgi:STE24 endopeptidase
MLALGIAWIARFPFDLVALWWERRHGVSHQGYVTWAVNDFLSVGGEFLFISLALLIVMGIASVLRRRWWLPAVPALMSVAILYALVQPYLIPDVHPLRDPRVAADAERLAGDEGIPGTPVRVQNTRNLGGAPNAEATGFGPSKRVIVWDTLLRRFPRPEINVVLGHELGHLSRHHIWKLLAWAALLALPILLVVEVLTRRRGGLHEPTAVPLAILVVAALLVALSPLDSAFSRRLESEADWVALKTTRDPGAAVNLFRRFGRIALEQPRPPSWSIVLEDHPTIIRRIEMAEAWRGRYGG